MCLQQSLCTRLRVVVDAAAVRTRLQCIYTRTSPQHPAPTHLRVVVDAAAVRVPVCKLYTPLRPHAHLRVVVDAVGVCEDAAPRDDEAAAAAAVLPLALPRQRKVGLRVDAEHLGDGGGQTWDQAVYCYWSICSVWMQSTWGLGGRGSR